MGFAHQIQILQAPDQEGLETVEKLGPAVFFELRRYGNNVFSFYACDHKLRSENIFRSDVAVKLH